MLLTAVSAFFQVGCVVGQKYPYHTAEVVFTGECSGKVAVVAQDQRPYVVDGSTNPEFVGVQRSGLGIPWNVGTESRKSFAQDVSGIVARSLRAKGVDVVEVLVSPSVAPDGVKTELRRSQARRSMWITVREWKSDTYVNISLYFDLVLAVLNDNGHLLKEKSTSGSQEISGSFWRTVGEAKEQLPAYLKVKIELLLNDHEVLAALK